MNLLQKAVSYLARSIGLTDPRLYRALGSVPTSSGETVNTASVLGLAAAWACVNLLAGTIASLPLMVYRTRNGARTVASDHPLYRILHDSPNADQTALDFWEFVCASLELHGNAYAEVVRARNGRIIALGVPITPELVTVLPAIALMSISGIDRNILKPGSRRQVTERVQVSVLAATYPAAKALMRAARAATADQMPTVTGIENVVVHTDAAGPDFTDPETGIFIQTQDLRVSFLETV